MRKALRGAIGTLLASGVLGLTRPVAAQTPTPPLWSQSAPVQKVQYEENIILSEGHNRLEAMKAQLTLLADITTFPYYLGANVSGENLQLHGYVPNDMVRQRALSLARRSTFLNVTDGLKVQSNLSMRPPLRAVEIVQKEGGALLAKNFGAAGRQMHVEARSNGLVIVTGTVDSVEDKLAVSKAFRQLPGCFAVLNQLAVPPIVRDGQRVMQVTKDGSLTVPASSLGGKTEHVAAEPHPPRLTPVAPPPPNAGYVLPMPQPTMPAPKALPPRSPEARGDELRLPTPTPAKPSRTPPTSSREKSDKAQAVKPPPPVMKWGQTSPSLESASKKADAAKKSAALPAPKPALPAPKPALPAPKVIESHSLNARDGEMRLPAIMPEKPHSVQPAPAHEQSDKGSAAKPPAPITKWGQTSPSLESASKKTDAAKKSPGLPAPRPASKLALPAPKAVEPHGLDARDGELRLPAITPEKPHSARPASSHEKSDKAQAAKPPAPIMKRGQTSPSLESASKKTDAAKVPIALQTPKLAMPAPKAIEPHSLDARDGELRLPTIVPEKPRSVRPASSPEKNDRAGAAKLPIPVTKRSHPAMSWESEHTEKTTATSDTAKQPIVKSATFHRAEKEKTAKEPAAKTETVKQPIVKSATFSRIEKKPEKKPIEEPVVNTEMVKQPIVKSATFHRAAEEKPAKEPVASTETMKQPIVKSATLGRAAEPLPKPAKKNKTDSFAAQHSPTSADNKPMPAPSAALTTPPSPARWKRSATSEESEPRSAVSIKPMTPPPPPSPPVTRVTRLATATSAKAPPVQLDRPSRWPPAYVGGHSQVENAPPESVPHQPEVVSRQPEVVSRRPETVIRQPEKVDPPPAIVSRHPEKVLPPPAIVSRQPEKVNPPPAIVSRQPEKVNPPPAIVNRQPEKANPPPAIVSRPHEMVSRQAETINRPPATVSHQPETISHQPQMFSGQPAVIVFEDDEPAMRSAAAKVPPPMARPIVPANLKQQLKDICGRQARDVFVEMQRNGNVLVTVKVPSASIGDELTRKVLTVPEMASPNVQLKMDIAP